MRESENTKYGKQAREATHEMNSPGEFATLRSYRRERSHSATAVQFPPWLLLVNTTATSSRSITRGGPALDLGSGPGFQSIALAQLGFSPVIAMDTSAELLDELRSHRGHYRIEIVERDLLSLDALEMGSEATVAVCMGDTLTHLDSKDSVRRLFAAVLHKLVRGGRFAITYRDLSVALAGADRF